MAVVLPTITVCDLIVGGLKGTPRQPAEKCDQEIAVFLANSGELLKSRLLEDKTITA